MKRTAFLNSFCSIIRKSISIGLRIGKEKIKSVLGKWFLQRRTRIVHRTRRVWFSASATAGLLVASCFAPQATAQLPTGADVVAGQAAIAQAANSLDLNATSNQTIVNWDSFSIGAGKTVNLNLPDASSSILNRVTSANLPSSIAGALNSNGNVMLVNPSGIMVTSSGMMNTNGFTASVFDITNEDFLNGGANTFSANGSAKAITNAGTINTGSGGAHLIANDINNSGIITSSGGNITLSGGGSVTLDNGVTYVQPSMSTLSTTVSPTAGLIQNSGTIRATGAATSGGEVYLVNPNGNILHDGTIDSRLSLRESSEPVNASFAERKATIGGHVQLEADNIKLGESSSIDATGTHGGGDVLVGGDWQGSGDMTQATTVTMQAGATIDASATEHGDGGKIVLWSDVHNLDSVTKAFGTLIARAGELFGDGGQIETSGQQIVTDGISVNAGAENGTGGHWLIDPYNYVIDAVAASNIVSALNGGTSVTVTTTANNGSFGSSGTNTDLGDITVTSDVVTGAMSGDATLTLQAARHIDVGANIDATQNGNTAELNIVLLADIDDSGDGINIVSADTIKTNGGDLQFGDGSTASIGGQTVKVGGDVYINGSVAQSLETSGGSITVNGETIVANSSVSGVTFDSDGGNIVFDGLLNSGNQYNYVDGPNGQSNSWDWARTDARNGTAGGSTLGDSYMVTITSRLENAIAGITADYRGAWIGAYRDPSTSNWFWADGPEGGQQFFTQSGAGGTTESGWYSNFGPGEPNGTGTGGETRGQFFGDAGQWNDLSPSTSFAASQASQYSVLGYVRETNLAPTAVTVDAGGGNVTFNGGIGGGKAIASLDVISAATVVNGNALVTTGAQDYSSALNITSTIGLEVSGTTLTTGGALDFSAADNLTLGASLDASGNVSISSDEILLSGNQSISAGVNDVTLTTDDVSGAVLTLNTTGHFTYAPKANAWSSSGIGGQLDFTGSISSDTFTGASDADWLTINNYSTLGGLTLGKDGNTSSIYVYNPMNIAGPVNLIGDNITIADDINTTAGGVAGDVLLKGSGNVELSGTANVTTNGGNVTLWSNVDGGNVDGYVHLSDGSSIATGGGHVWIGGSTDKTNPGTLVGDGSTTWNGLTVGNGYSVSGDGIGVLNGGSWRAGIALSNADISTGGGDFYAAGLDVNDSGGSAGIVHGGTNGSINAGSGTIEMNGFAEGDVGYAILIGLHPSGVDNSLTLSSSSNEATAVSLFGESVSTNTSQVPLLIEDNLTIEATGTGGITLTGRNAATEGIRVGSGVDSGNLELLANSGTITIDTGDDSLSFFNATSQSYIGAKAGSAVTSSMSDIVMVADEIANNSANLNINTSGSLAFEAFSAAASGTSADTTGWDFGTTLSGLTIGTDAKPYDTVTLGTAATIAGSVNVYGGNININADITTTTAGSDVLSKASGNIDVGASTVVQTNNGHITLWGDSDNSGQGGIQLQNQTVLDTRTAADRLAGTHTTGGGNITIAGGLDDAGASSGIGNGTASDGTPDGFAVNMSGTGAGVLFGNTANLGQDADIDVFSGGGDIIVNGRSTQDDGAFSFGIQMFQGVTLDGGEDGNITLYGESNSASTAAVGLDIASYRREDVLAETTIQTVDGSISIHGTARNGTAGNIGLAFDSPTASVGRIQATGTGSITLEGDAVGAGSTALRLSSLDILASSGDIQLLGTGGTFNLNALSDRGVFVGARAGTDVTSSTSDVLFRADAITIQDGLAFDTTGSLVIEPASASFSSTLNWTAPLVTASSTLNDLTLGKSGNTTTIQIGGTTTTTGQQDYYGPLQLTSDATLATTDSDVNFHSAINSDGTARSLIVSPGTANAVFDGEVGGSAALSSLTVNGTASVNANIMTDGAQNWTDTITLGGSGTRTLSAGTLSTQAIVGGSKDFQLVTDDLTLGGNVASTGSIVIAPKTSGTNVGVGNISGTFSFDNSDFAQLQDGFSSITIGNAASGDLVVGGITALVDDLTLQAGASGDLFVNDSLSWSSDNTLTLAAGQDIFVNRDIDISGSAAGLNLYYGGTNGTTAPNSSYGYYIDVANRREINFAETTAGLKIGNETFTLIDSVADLQGMSANGRYALTGDLDLFGTTYTEAFYSTTFTGKLDGLGHEVDGLTVRANAGGNFGLFGQLSGASVRHLGVTDIDILGQSTSNAAANDLRIGGIVGNVSGSGTTVLDGVWSTGVIATKQGSQQDVFYAGGIAGGHDSGTLQILRSFSTANVSSQGSHSGKMALGGLLGDSGDNNGISGIGGSAQHVVIDRSYATGSIVEGTYDGYYGSGGLVGVIYGDSATLTDSFSRSNVVGGISSGGIAGFSAPGTTKTYQRLYTTLDRFGNGTTPSDSYHSGTLDTATNNGMQLPAGWSSEIWAAGEFPTLKAVGVPASLLYVQVTGGTGVYGDLAVPTYQIVDIEGNVVTLGSGDYVGLDGVSGTGRYTLGQFTSAGNYSNVSYLSGLGFTGDDANLFALNPFTTAGSFAITPRSITAVLANTGVDKVYDGNVNAGSGYTPTWSFTNIVSGDSATLNTGSMFFNDTDVLDANLFTINGLSLAGITGSNGSVLGDYSLSNTTSSVAANITAKPLVISGLFANDKIYDATVTAIVDSSGATFSGIVSGDSVSLTGVTGTFADKNVDTDKTVSITGVFAGTDAANYSATVPSSLTADITAKSLTVSGITAANKVYDATTAATVDGSGVSFGGLVSGDDLSIDTLSGLFSDKNIANGKAVNLTTTYTGTDASNYSIIDQSSATASITPKAITVSGLSANNRVYDATTSTTVDHSGAVFGGMISGDNLSASNTVGTLADKNVGTAKAVTLSGTTYGGTDAGNYTFTDQTSSTADITQKAITVSGLNADDKIYDATTSATVDHSGAVFAGIVSGDDLSASGTTGSFANKNVGSGKAVSLSGTTYGGSDVGNYSFTDQSSSTADITKKALVVSGITAANKVYDGTTSAALDDSGKVYGGLIAGDDFQMTPFAGSFDSKNVGDDKTVTITSYNVGGTDYSNYDVTLQLEVLADITQKAITVSGITANNKIYDGTTASTLDSSGLTFGGIVSGDNLTASGIGGVFSDKNVANGKTVTLSGASYGGTDVGNYSFTDQTSAVANITQKAVTVSGIAANNKVYDGTTASTLDVSGLIFGGIVSGDDLTISGTTGVFGDKNVADGKVVSLSGTSYGGSDVGNYSFTDQTSTTADITQKAITVSGIAANNKTYDGTTASTLDVSGLTFGGIVSGDSLTASGTTGVFSDKNAADGKTVSLSGASYGGTDVGNYSFADQTSATANIAQKAITVSGVTANNKVYDGTTASTLDTSGLTFGGIVSGDNLTASGIGGVFSDKNVADLKTVTLSGASYGGTDVENYSFTNQTSATANITQKAIIVSGIAANNKVYDGTTASTLDVSGLTFGGIVTGDDLIASGIVGTFSDKNVANGKTVSLSGTSYSGADVGNYSFTDQAIASADITQKAIAISGIAANNKIYDGTTSATLELSGLTFGGIVTGDDLTVSGTAGVFGDKNVDDGKTVSLSGTTYGGSDVGNYSFTDQSSALANITPKAISVSGITANSKTYDGSTAATLDVTGLTFNGIVSGDDLGASGTMGVFSDKNAAVGKTVTLSGTSYGGTDVDNYAITDQTTTTADISQKAIVVSGITAADKIYDGSVNATVDASAVNFSGLLSGDDLNIDSLTGTFSDKNAANGKTVGLSTSYAGVDVNNYAITDQATSTASIAQKVLTINLSGQGSREYDGTTAISFGGIAPTIDGVVSGDAINIESGSVTGLVDKNVGTHKDVTYTGFGISGADTANYSLSSGSAQSTATITAKALTISGIAANDKVYDGNSIASLDSTGLTLGGLVSGDDFTVSSTGTFSDKNVSAGKLVSLSNIFNGVDVGNYSITDQSSATANITAKAITISGITASNKVYDGSNSATVDIAGATFNGIVAGDDLNISGTSGLFSDKNVAAGKTVNLSGTTFGGVDLNNYAITDQTTTQADITRLGSVTWIGGSTGDWSDPSNWAGGAIPDLANVENVIIPDGVTPIFDSNVAGPVDIESLNGGNLQQESGTLNVAGSFNADEFIQNNGTFSTGTFTAENYTQNNGSFNADSFTVENYTQLDGQVNVADNFTVTNSFTQTGGQVSALGDATITHNTGELIIGDLTGQNVDLNSTNGGVKLNNVSTNGDFNIDASGKISQTTDGTLSVTGESRLTTPGEIALTNGSNVFGGTVFVDASAHAVQSNASLNVTKQGSALAEESNQAREETTRDALVRPSTPDTEEQGSIQPALLQWFTAFQEFIVEITPESLIQGVSNQTVLRANQDQNEVRLEPAIEEDE